MKNYRKQHGSVLGRVLVALLVIVAVAGVVYLIAGINMTGQDGSRLADVYQYGDEPLPVTDPAMITYAQVQEIDTDFGELRGLAVTTDGKIIAAGDERLTVFSGAGDRLAAIVVPGRPQCLSISADGTMFVALKDRIIVLSGDGAVKVRWPVLEGTPAITSISVTPDGGNAFIADRGNGWVVHCDGDGKILNFIGRDDAGKADHFNVKLGKCFDLTVDGGELLVIDPIRHAIETYSFDGMLQSRWADTAKGIEGFYGCCNPTDIAVAGGAVVTSQKGARLPRIKVYDKNGKFLTVVAGPDSFADDGSLIDLAVDSGGRILATDSARKSIRVFKKK